MKEVGQGKDGAWATNDPLLICDPLGTIRGFGYNYGMEFSQTAFTSSTVEPHLANHLDRRPHKLPDDPPSARFGICRRLVGRKFVIESNGYDQRSLVGSDATKPLYPHSPDMKIVEGYRRLDYGKMQMTLTINDPKIYTKPWTTTGTALLHPGAEIGSISAYRRNRKAQRPANQPGGGPIALSVGVRKIESRGGGIRSFWVPSTFLLNSSFLHLFIYHGFHRKIFVGGPRRLLLIITLGIFGFALTAKSQSAAAKRVPATGGLAANLEKLRDAALASDYAWRQAAHLTENIGPRLSGSPQAQQAVDYVASELGRLGLDVKLEKVTVPHWVRGEERAELTIFPGQPPPVPGQQTSTAQKIVLTALGNSTATPPEGLTAEVVVAGSFDELAALGRNKVAGRIVLFNEQFDKRMAAAGRGLEAYETAVAYRGRGPLGAARRRVGGASAHRGRRGFPALAAHRQ